jgi:hypothetical protein
MDFVNKKIMNAEINEALENVETNPPPTKKIRREQQEVSDNRTKLSSRSPKTLVPGAHEAARKQLKSLLLKNPDLAFNNTQRIDEMISEFNDDEIFALLDNAKIEVGLMTPNQNAIGFISGLGAALEKFLGKRGIVERMIKDDELLSMVEYYVPDTLYWMSFPLRIFHRITTHINDAFMNPEKIIE